MSKEKRNSVNIDKGGGESITVLCRFRPFKEVAATSTKDQFDRIDQQKILTFPESFIKQSVKIKLDAFGHKEFSFDRMHDVCANQVDLFKGDKGVEEVVEAVMNGFNGTVLAYGQTSAGKTHTMEGPDVASCIQSDGSLKSSAGVIPRTVERIFSIIKEKQALEISSLGEGVTEGILTEYSLIVSYFEIYCEKLCDLLRPDNEELKLREVVVGGSKGASTFLVQDVTEVVCTSMAEVFHVLETGKVHRSTAPTLMNAESSRSHSILLIKVQQNKVHHSNLRDHSLNQSTPVSSSTSRLYLVDLAGSEKIEKTGATGDRLKEAQMINKSLTTFGMVINALSTPGGAGHVPYRDSKLTMVLSDSIGGNSKTTLIICCSPDIAQLAETQSTLRFGERAKKIKKLVYSNDEFLLSQLHNEYYLTCSIGDLRSLFLICRKELVSSQEAIKLLKAGGGSGETNTTAACSMDEPTAPSPSKPKKPSRGSTSGDAGVDTTHISLEEEVTWKAYTDANGYVFYVNQFTKESVWEIPDDYVQPKSSKGVAAAPPMPAITYSVAASVPVVDLRKDKSGGCKCM